MIKKTWSIEWTVDSQKQLFKLDKPIQKRVISYLKARISESADPRRYGKALTGSLSNYWSYRVGDYRVIVDLLDSEMIVLVVQLDHRKQVYN